MTNGDPEGQIFLSMILKRIMDYFSCSPSNTAFLKFKERLTEVPELYAVMQHSMMTSL